MSTQVGLRAPLSFKVWMHCAAGLVVGCLGMMLSRASAQGGPAMEVDPGTGVVTLCLPLGPGIGRSDLRYVPVLVGRFAPRIGGSPADPMAVLDPSDQSGFELSPGNLELWRKPGVDAADGLAARWTYPDGSGGCTREEPRSGASAASIWAAFGYGSAQGPEASVASGPNGPAEVLVLAGRSGDILIALPEAETAPTPEGPLGGVGFPSRLLTVRGTVAYEYHWAGVGGARSDPEAGNSGYYRLAAMRATGGDAVTFSYGPNGVDFQADWEAWTLRVALAEGCATGPGSGHDAVPETAQLQVHYAGPDSVPGYTLQVALQPGEPIRRQALRVSRIEGWPAGGSTRFGYGPVSAAGPVGAGDDPEPSVLRSIELPNRSLQLDWGGWFKSDPGGDGAWAFGLAELRDQARPDPGRGADEQVYRRVPAGAGRASTAAGDRRWVRQSRHFVFGSASGQGGCQTFVRDRWNLGDPAPGSQGVAEAVGVEIPTFTLVAGTGHLMPVPGQLTRRMDWGPEAIERDQPPDPHGGRPLALLGGSGLKGGGGRSEPPGSGAPPAEATEQKAPASASDAPPPAPPAKEEVRAGPISYDPMKGEVTMEAIAGPPPAGGTTAPLRYRVPIPKGPSAQEIMRQKAVATHKAEAEAQEARLTSIQLSTQRMLADVAHQQAQQRVQRADQERQAQVHVEAARAMHTQMMGALACQQMLDAADDQRHKAEAASLQAASMERQAAASQGQAHQMVRDADTAWLVAGAAARRANAAEEREAQAEQAALDAERRADEAERMANEAKRSAHQALEQAAKPSAKAAPTQPKVPTPAAKVLAPAPKVAASPAKTVIFAAPLKASTPAPATKPLAPTPAPATKPPAPAPRPATKPPTPTPASETKPPTPGPVQATKQPAPASAAATKPPAREPVSVTKPSPAPASGQSEPAPKKAPAKTTSCTATSYPDPSAPRIPIVRGEDGNLKFDVAPIPGATAPAAGGETKATIGQNDPAAVKTGPPMMNCHGQGAPAIGTGLPMMSCHEPSTSSRTSQSGPAPSRFAPAGPPVHGFPTPAGPIPPDEGGKSPEGMPSLNLGTRAMGAVKVAGAVAEASMGAAVTLGSGGAALPVGGAIVLHAADVAASGVKQVITGEHTPSLTSKGIQAGAQAAGVSPGTAAVVGETGDALLSFAGGIAGARAITGLPIGPSPTAPIAKPSTKASPLLGAGANCVEVPSSQASALQRALANAKPTSGHPTQLIAELEDGSRVMFRKDFGAQAHPVGGPFKGAGPIDHYNIEIQVMKPNGTVKTIENIHAVPDGKGGYIWWGIRK